jgi:hypothetical protein
MKKLKSKYQKPVDYLVNRPEPVIATFVGQFLAAHQTADPEAIERLDDLTAATYYAAKQYWPQMSAEERISTNAMLYLFEGLHKGDTAEPVAEPPDAPHK